MRVLKWLFGGLLAIGLLGAGTLAVLSRDTPPSHPALAEADLPPTIPVRDFFADQRSEWRHRVSADGRYIAYRAVHLGQEVVVLERRDGTHLGRLHDVHSHYFDDAGRGLLAFRDGRLWLIDPEAPDEESWQDVTPRGFNHYFIENRPTDPNARWLVASRDRNPAFAALYTVAQDGSDKTPLIEN